MFKQNFDQRILEQRGAEQILNYDHSSVLRVNQEPFEVKVMNKVHEEGVQLVRVSGVEDPGLVQLARDDAPGTHLPSVPALGRVPAYVKNNGMLLGDQPDTLIKGHGFLKNISERMYCFY